MDITPSFPSIKKTRTAKPAGPRPALNLGGLRVRLGMIFLLLLGVVGGVAWYLNGILVADGLVEETFRYEIESSRRHAAELEQTLGRAETIAVTMAGLVARTRAGLEALKPTLPELIEVQPNIETIAAFGIWPVENFNPRADRESLHWIRSGVNGQFQYRDDYNVKGTESYTRERWYVPARFFPTGKCYWSPSYKDPLLLEDVVTCATPVRSGDTFLGVATVSLSVAKLAKQFQMSANQDAGYSILLDRDNRIIGLSEKVSRALNDTRPVNAADLAKRNSSFTELALGLHRWNERFQKKVLQSDLYNASTISALRETAREMSREEAESALLSYWSSILDKKTPEPLIEKLAGDPVLNQPSYALFLDIPGPNWRLARVTGANDGFAGANYVVKQSLVVTLGAVTIALFIAHLLTGALVVNRLQKINKKLRGTEVIEDALDVKLDDTANDEVGETARWHLERIRQLKDLLERVVSANAAVTVEAEGRRTALQQQHSAESRAAQIMRAVSDAIIFADETGKLTDFNSEAEPLFAMSRREAQGSSFSDIITAKMPETGDEIPDIVARVLETDQPVHFSHGIHMICNGEKHHVMAQALPLSGSKGKPRGVMVLVKKVQKISAAAALAGDSVHAIGVDSGATRSQCLLRIRGLLDSARMVPTDHSFAQVDIDHIGEINRSISELAGDQIIEYTFSQLESYFADEYEVFRLGGDKFGVLAKNTPMQMLQTRLVEFQQELQKDSWKWEDREIEIQISGGVVGFGRDSENVFDLVRRASEACSAAKHAGRNAVNIYEAGMSALGSDRDDQVWISRIQRALEQNLFHLTTQWILPENGNNAQSAFEVLLSIEDEEGFWTTSGVFMPIAERHHLTFDIDKWVIQKAFRIIAEKAGTLDRMDFCALNIGSASLANPELISFIAEQIEETGVNTNQICFELSEEAIERYPSAARTFCESLKGFGCRVTFEHFVGRRLHDVQLLKSVPVDMVKLAADQFPNLIRDSAEQTVAKSVVELTHTLGKKLIITSLDDAELLEAWRKLGADYLQGFVISKPTPFMFSTASH